MSCGARLEPEEGAAPAVLPEVQRCPHCREAVEKEAAFCPFCGRAMVEAASPPSAATARERVLCPHCHAEVEVGMAFCLFCGARLVAPPLGETAEAAKHVALCQQCGASVEEGVEVCPACGYSMLAEVPPAPSKAKVAPGGTGELAREEGATSTGTVEAVLTCPQCSAPLKSGVQICDVCGYRAEERLPRRRWGWIATTVVLLSGIGGGGWYAYHHHPPTREFLNGILFKIGVLKSNLVSPPVPPPPSKEGGGPQGPGGPSSQRDRNVVRLIVITNPGSCQVFLDGQFVGTTDTRGRLEIQTTRGRRTLRVSRDGYQEQPRTVNLVMPQEEHRFVLSPLLLNVQIMTVPPEARVFLDGEDKGTTSSDGELLIPRVRAGSRRLRVEKKRYLPYEGRVEVSEGNTRFTVTLSLNPIWRELEQKLKEVEEALRQEHISEAFDACDALVRLKEDLPKEDKDEALQRIASSCGKIAEVVRAISRQLIARYTGLYGLRVEPNAAAAMRILYERLQRLHEALPGFPKSDPPYHDYARYWRAKAQPGEPEPCGPENFDPNEAEIHYDLGWCTFRDRQRAKVHFFRARDLKDWALPYFGLAKLDWKDAERERDKKIKQRKFEAIIADLTRAIALDGDFTYYFYAERAIAFAKIGKTEKATADGQQAVRLKPASAYTHYALGFVYYQAGKKYYSQAQRELETALRIKDVDPLTPEQRKLVSEWLADMQRRR
jgi:tetratricopeptide (TPR) repeat protein/RNA polymerase subunit RPABC4/transcription elongation factor Spt4